MLSTAQVAVQEVRKIDALTKPIIHHSHMFLMASVSSLKALERRLGIQVEPSTMTTGEADWSGE